MGSQQSTAEGQNPLLCPAGHAALDAAQGSFSYEHTVLVKLLIQQHPKALLSTALNPFSIQPVFVVRVALTQVQDLVLSPVEIDEVFTGPPLKPVQIPLDGSFPSCMSMALHGLMSPADLLREPSVPLCMFLAKMLHSVALSTDP